MWGSVRGERRGKERKKRWNIVDTVCSSVKFFKKLEIIKTKIKSIALLFWIYQMWSKHHSNMLPTIIYFKNTWTNLSLINRNFARCIFFFESYFHPTSLKEVFPNTICIYGMISFMNHSFFVCLTLLHDRKKSMCISPYRNNFLWL